MFRDDGNEELKKLREELEELKKSMRALAEEKIAEDTRIEEPHTPEDPQTEDAEAPSIEDQPPEGDEETPPEEPPLWEESRGEWRDHSDRPRRIYVKRDFGDRLGDYISEFVEDVMEGVSSELERSIFADPHVRHRRRERRKEAIDSKAAATAMSALGNEHRIKVLEELSYGGAYAAGLQEVLTEISPSTLSSHLDVLQEAGLVTQERRRGRYLVTIPGRLAVKMAYQIADRIERDQRHD